MVSHAGPTPEQSHYAESDSFMDSLLENNLREPESGERDVNEEDSIKIGVISRSLAEVLVEKMKEIPADQWEKPPEAVYRIDDSTEITLAFDKPIGYGDRTHRKARLPLGDGVEVLFVVTTAAYDKDTDNERLTSPQDCTITIDGLSDGSAISITVPPTERFESTGEYSLDVFEPSKKWPSRVAVHSGPMSAEFPLEQDRDWPKEELPNPQIKSWVYRGREAGYYSGIVRTLEGAEETIAQLVAE